MAIVTFAVTGARDTQSIILYQRWLGQTSAYKWPRTKGTATNTIDDV